MNIENAKRDLLKIIVKQSLKRGEFKLTSGKISNYYLDVKKVTLDPQGSALLAEILSQKIIKNKVDSIGGPMIGADPIVGSVITYGFLRDFFIRGFIVRNEAKLYGLHKLIEGNIREKDRVIIVDDVSTTGSSLYRGVKAVEDIDCKVVKVIPIVDRNEGGRQFFTEKGYDYDPIINVEDIL